MTNASTETAARGFEIYRRQDRRGTLPGLRSVNEALASEGREPIHQRSIQHYENLIKAGQLVYMPINEFDVLRRHGLAN